MTNISQEVHDYLNKSPAVVKNLKDGLINVRALASHIIEKTEMGASLDAVMTAIRRYQKDIKIEEGERTAQLSEILKNSRISTKSRLMTIEVKRHFNLLRDIVPKIMSRIDVYLGEVLRVIEGRKTVMFIIDHAKKDEIMDLIPKGELISIQENLGEINIILSEKYGNVPGILGPLTNELAINNINIIEMIGGMPEIALIIKEEDISRCHDLLLRFFYKQDNFNPAKSYS